MSCTYALRALSQSKSICRDFSYPGAGVFAAVEIVRGEAILAIDDFRVVPPQRPPHPEAGELDIHCDYLADGLVVLMRPLRAYRPQVEAPLQKILGQ